MITLIDYKKICKICDDILLKYKDDLSVNAISFLGNIR